MKKLLSGLLCILMAVFLCGCGDNAAEETEKPTPTTEEATQPETAPAVDTQPAPVDPYAPIIEALLMGSTETEGVPGFPMMSHMYMRYDVSEIGYALTDLDGDGQAELLLSSMDAPFVFDAFTVQDGTLVHIFTGAERCSPQVCADGYFKLTWAGNAAQSGVDYFQFKNAQTVFSERIAYDAWYAEEMGVIDDLTQATEDNCYFLSSSEDTKDYRHISSEEAAQKLQELNALHPELEIQYISITQYAG